MWETLEILLDRDAMEIIRKSIEEVKAGDFIALEDAVNPSVAFLSRP